MMCKPINFVVAELEMRDIKLWYTQYKLLAQSLMKTEYKVIDQNS